MKKWKVFSALAVGVGAAAGGAYLYAKKNPEKVRRQAEISGHNALAKTLKGMSGILPSKPSLDFETYHDENFLPGQSLFRESAKRGVKWSLGYARRSILPEGFTGEDCYIAGFMSLPPNKVDGVIDDQAVRVIALDDNSWRGSAVFAVVDCIGLSAPEIRAIREELRDFAREHNVCSINISATHCHSAVDTQGLWGDLPSMLKTNIKALREKRYDDTVSGKNKAFMENFKQQTVDAIKEAVLGMKKGTLSYVGTDEYKYAHDKRKPDVWIRDIGKLRFVPSDGSEETVAAFLAAHPVAVGDDNKSVSADYIYYMEEEMNKANVNFIFFQGPQLAVTTDRGHIPPEFYDGEGEGYQRYGRHVAQFLLNIPEEQEEKLTPILNIRVKELLIPCDNAILVALAKLDIVSNRVILKDGEPYFATEVGYAELGKYLHIGMVPGELAPEIAVGGAYSAEESYNRESWDFPSMREVLPDYGEMMVIGLCNDSVGYILPDNDYGSFFASGHYEETVSAGKRAGSTIAKGFADLTAECAAMEIEQAV